MREQVEKLLPRDGALVGVKLRPIRHSTETSDLGRWWLLRLQSRKNENQQKEAQPGVLGDGQKIVQGRRKLFGFPRGKRR